MRTINYSFHIQEQDEAGKVKPILTYSGIYPSPAHPNPVALAQAWIDFLNEEFGTHLVVKVDTESIIKELVP